MDEVEAAATPAPRRVARATVGAGAGAGSTLTDRERADYHYVERDLRNIAILTAAMFGLLLLAWFVFTATGIAG